MDSSARVQSSLGGSTASNPASTARAPPLAVRSTVASENLTDSAVDFQLRELAVRPSCPSLDKGAASASPSFESVAELLDLSRDFSNCSSFNSDISGELRRLASAPRRETRTISPVSVPDDLEELGLGLALFSLESLESASVASLEPTVRACVDGLGPSSPEGKRAAAAAAIRLLAKHRSDFRVLIGSSGAIPALVPLLKSADPEAQESAVTALLNLSLEETNKGPIMAPCEQNAACALLSLSIAEEKRAAIGACGAIPPLVALLVGGTSRGKKDALATLYKLCSTRRNKERAVAAGAVPPLVGLVGERCGGTAEKALVVLGSLTAIPQGREAVVEAGGIPVLVEAAEEAGPGGRGAEFAVHALLQLCADSSPNRGLLVGEGAILTLVAVSQCGTSLAKHKAEMLLRLLREQRAMDETSPAAAT